MNVRTVYEKYAVRVISAVCLCAGLSLYFNSLLGTELSGAVLFFAAVFFTLFFTAFGIVQSEAVSGWKKILFYLIILIITAVCGVFALRFNIPVADSFNWLFFSRSANAENALLYSLISQTVLLFAAVGAAFNLLYFRYVRFAAGAGLLVFCIIMAIFERNAGFIEILLIFIFIFIVLHEKLLNKKTALTYLLPFIITAGLITAVLPSKQEPIQWNSVKNIIREVQNIITNISEQISFNFGRGGNEFGISMTGYSDSGNIGGAVTLSDKPAVRITNHTQAGVHIYLVGSVMDNYTGRGWTRTNNFDSTYPEHKLDVLELILALYYGGVFDEDNEVLGEIFALREIGIEYLDTRTRTMFHAPNMMSVVVPESYRSDTGGSSMLFVRTQGAGTAYRMSYADFNYSSETLINLLNNSNHRIYDIEPHMLGRLITANFPGASFGGVPEDYAQLLRARRDKIYSVYTGLPDSVPERVYALAREITADCGSSYAKMAAIEQYLSSNFAYTRTPPIAALESSGDFTDAFLFEMQEGFCTYFATSAAVLGRAAGIPTRYVQGYASPAVTTARSRSWNILQNTAHAWVEAYIDGAGWIPFEPSPTFADVRYGEWINQRVIVPQTYTPAAPLERQPSFESGQFKISEPEPDELNDELRRVYLFAAVIGISVIIIAALSVLIGIHAAAWRTRKKYREAPPAEKLLLDYKTVLLLFELTGKKLLTGETASSYAERIGDADFIRITCLFERVRYGGDILSAAEAGAAADFKEALLIQAKKHLGKLKYYLYLIKFC
ncbi:MAG: transglutaminase-like domain-containing protein [Oscillospiraceae bacterium]|nr:transglutaminase-like domain-containing protein [Oscillospiraceae bacterium]